MVFKDSHNIALYNWRLRSEKCGNSPEVRLESAKQELNMRLEEIKRRKKLQKKLPSSSPTAAQQELNGSTAAAELQPSDSLAEAQ